MVQEKENPVRPTTTPADMGQNTDPKPCMLDKTNAIKTGKPHGRTNEVQRGIQCPQRPQTSNEPVGTKDSGIKVDSLIVVQDKDNSVRPTTPLTDMGLKTGPKPRLLDKTKSKTTKKRHGRANKGEGNIQRPQSPQPSNEPVITKVSKIKVESPSVDTERKVDSKPFMFDKLNPKTKQSAIRLIGEKLTVTSYLNEFQEECLYDTGAQVCIMDMQLIEKRGWQKEIRQVDELLDSCDIKLRAANNVEIPYSGWIPITFRLEGWSTEDAIVVPFLVTREEIGLPILGTNVIEEMLERIDDGRIEQDTLHRSLQAAMHCDAAKIEPFVKLIQKGDEDLVVKSVAKKVIRIPAMETASILCRVKANVDYAGMPVMFEPDSPGDLPEQLECQPTMMSIPSATKTRISIPVKNLSNQDVFISPRTKLGVLQRIRSMVPADVKELEILKEEQKSTPSEEGSTGQDNTISSSPLEVVDKTLPVPPGREDNPSVQGTNGLQAVNGETATPSQGLSSSGTEKCGAKAKVTSVPQSSSKTGETKKRFLPAVDLSHLTGEERRLAEEMLMDECESFAVGDEIGDIPDLQMKILLENNDPVQKRYNTIPRSMYAEVKAHVEDLLNRGCITRSSSPYSSPVVVVRKKNGEMRLCVDYRALNEKTITDRHPLPRIQTMLDNLGGKSWFSLLDQKQAYHQGYLHEDSKHLSAFITPWGLYQWNRIPFGLSNAPPVFQRQMDEMLEDVRDEFASPYLDDVLVYSDAFIDHLEHNRTVLRRIREKGGKLKAEKCRMFKREVAFVGRIVNEDGYRMDLSNIEAMTLFVEKPPKTIGDLRRLLGMLGQFRKHIQDFSRIAKPLFQLLVGEEDSEGQISSKKKITLKEEHMKSIEKLVKAVTSHPILAYPDFEKPFEVHVDASETGLGAILYQDVETSTKVIKYASRTLNPAEKNYHSGKLEFLALKWAITEAFHEYLYYAGDCTVYTDNNPLTYVMTTSKLNAVGQRWVNNLANYSLKIKYRPGVVHKDADCISRWPLDIEQYRELCTEEMTKEDINAVNAEIRRTEDISIKSLLIEESLIPCTTPRDTHQKSTPEHNSQENAQDVKRMQLEDPDIKPIMECMLVGRKPTKKTQRKYSRISKLILSQWKHLLINDVGVLIRKEKENDQVVLPKVLKSIVYEELHNKMGHLGAERVYSLAKERFYWPMMKKEITEHITKSCECIINRKPSQPAYAPLQSLQSAAPMDLVCIDLLHLEQSSGGFEYILTITDHFTRFAQTYALKNKEAKTVAKVLFQDFMQRFGSPVRLLHDQGKEFENKLFYQLQQHMGITKLRTTPYHPQGNGQCERMNETMLMMLRSLSEAQKKKWKDYLNMTTHAYNCTKNSATGYSPYYLLFGIHPVLPIDLILNTERFRKGPTSHRDYVNTRKQVMKEAYEIAGKCTEKQRGWDKRRLDNRKQTQALETGDRVLVKNTQTGGPGKLRSFWEKAVYEVVECRGDNNGVIYKVKKIGETAEKTRILHRNMLMCCNSLPLQENEISKEAESRKSQEEAVKDTEVNLSAERDGSKILQEQLAKISSDNDSDSSDESLCSIANQDGLTPSQLVSLRRKLVANGTKSKSVNKREPITQSTGDGTESKSGGRTGNGNLVAPKEIDRTLYNKLFNESLTEKSFLGFNSDRSGEIIRSESCAAKGDNDEYEESVQDDHNGTADEEARSEEGSQNEDRVSVSLENRGDNLAENDDGGVMEEELVDVPQEREINGQGNNGSDDSDRVASTRNLPEQKRKAKMRSTSTPPRIENNKPRLTDPNITPNTKARVIRQERNIANRKDKRNEAIEKRRKIQSESSDSETEQVTRRGRSVRKRDPPVRLCYDTLGARSQRGNVDIKSVTPEKANPGSSERNRIISWLMENYSRQLELQNKVLGMMESYIHE